MMDPELPIVIQPMDTTTRLLVERVTDSFVGVRLSCLRADVSGAAVTLAQWDIVRLVAALVNQLDGDELAAAAIAVQARVDDRAENLARWNAARKTTE